MNPIAILSLIGSLYEQLQAALAREETLKAQLAQLQNGDKPSDTSQTPPEEVKAS